MAPFMPAAQRLGRLRGTVLQTVVNALFYVMSAGSLQHVLPKGFPPRSTVHRYSYCWRDDGNWARINHHLLMATRKSASRAAMMP